LAKDRRSRAPHSTYPRIGVIRLWIACRGLAANKTSPAVAVLTCKHDKAWITRKACHSRARVARTRNLYMILSGFGWRARRPVGTAAERRHQPQS